MSKKIFLAFLIYFFIYTLSTHYISIANSAMNQGENYLDLKSLNKNELAPILSQSPVNKADNRVKIFFTKSSLGTKAFKLSISNLLIDYGILSPTNPIIRESILSVFNASSYHFSIFTSENRPLFHPDGIIIPDTSCDNGTCTQHTASYWENTLTFGFGYKCENTTHQLCLTDFKYPNYFKQFANQSDKDNPVPVIQGVKTDKELEAKMIYKVNISSSQPPLRYSNTINYIMVPGY